MGWKSSLSEEEGFPHHTNIFASCFSGMLTESIHKSPIISHFKAQKSRETRLELVRRTSHRPRSQKHHEIPDIPDRLMIQPAASCFGPASEACGGNINATAFGWSRPGGGAQEASDANASRSCC